VQGAVGPGCHGITEGPEPFTGGAGFDFEAGQEGVGVVFFEVPGQAGFDHLLPQFAPVGEVGVGKVAVVGIPARRFEGHLFAVTEVGEVLFGHLVVGHPSFGSIDPLHADAALFVSLHQEVVGVAVNYANYSARELVRSRTLCSRMLNGDPDAGGGGRKEKQE